MKVVEFYATAFRLDLITHLPYASEESKELMLQFEIITNGRFHRIIPGDFFSRKYLWVWQQHLFVKKSECTVRIVAVIFKRLEIPSIQTRQRGENERKKETSLSLSICFWVGGGFFRLFFVFFQSLNSIRGGIFPLTIGKRNRPDVRPVIEELTKLDP